MADVREIGHIESFYEGVAKIRGLPGVFLHEVLRWKTGERAALVIGFDEEFVEALFFEPENINIDKPLFRTREVFKIPVGESYLGRVVDGLGQPIDNMGKISSETEDSVFRPAPAIIDRQPVSEPLSTGIKVIDAALPLGRGQRELIIGDRKLGKTTLAVDTVLNQRQARKAVRCVYVLCGQKRRQSEEVVSLLKEYNALSYTVVVSASAEDSFASQYLAPFVGCRIAEEFRDRGEHALIVYDDLSKHAKVYRNISLLLENAPGREAYPGDIFSLHAGLLERAAKLSEEKGGGSLTALPIAETQEGDITSFIPTNLISITDGQIYLERGLYEKGFLPAVNVGLSVSRVGSQAQPPLLRKVTSGLRLTLAQHKELQKLVQLETVISQESKRKIHRGELIVELLKQDKHICVPWQEQVILFWSVEQGFFDDLQEEKWPLFEKFLLRLTRTRYRRILEEISKEKWTKELEAEIKRIITDFKKEFLGRSDSI